MLSGAPHMCFVFVRFAHFAQHDTAARRRSIFMKQLLQYLRVIPLMPHRSIIRCNMERRILQPFDFIEIEEVFFSACTDNKINCATILHCSLSDKVHGSGAITAGDKDQMLVLSSVHAE